MIDRARPMACKPTDLEYRSRCYYARDSHTTNDGRTALLRGTSPRKRYPRARQSWKKYRVCQGPATINSEVTSSLPFRKGPDPTVRHAKSGGLQLGNLAGSIHSLSGQDEITLSDSVLIGFPTRILIDNEKGLLLYFRPGFAKCQPVCSARDPFSRHGSCRSLPTSSSKGNLARLVGHGRDFFALKRPRSLGSSGVRLTCLQGDLRTRGSEDYQVWRWLLRS